MAGAWSQVKLASGSWLKSGSIISGPPPRSSEGLPVRAQATFQIG